MVYFLQAIGDPRGPVKIGTSLGGKPALLRRLAELQIGNPAPIQCVAAMPGHYQEERRIHYLCGYQRIRGEWFRCEGPVADYVRRYRLRKPVEAPGDEEGKIARLRESAKRSSYRRP